MSNVRVLSMSRPEYMRMLLFLYPEYSLVSTPTVRSHFITVQDITSRSMRESLDYDYSDCIFVSSKVFDELWDETLIRRDVLQVAQRRFGSRRRTLVTVSTEGASFIDECISFLYGLDADSEDAGVLELLESLGTHSFMERYMQACVVCGVGRVSRSVNTYISKVMGNASSLYYRRARLRLGSVLRDNVEGAVLSERMVSAYYRRHFGDLTTLWFYMNLLRRIYFT